MKCFSIFLFILFTVFPLTFNSCSTPLQNENLNPWAEKAIRDIESIRETLKINHPAVFLSDSTSKEFNKWFIEGFPQAMALAKKAINFEGYYFALKYYTVGFKDGHLSFGPSGYDPFIKNFNFKWPQFLMDYQGVYPLVTQSEVPEIPNGSILLSCDGKTIDQLLESNVFPFYDARSTNSAKITWAPRLFMDLYNPFIEIPQECKIKINEQIKTVKLKWEKTEFSKIWPKYKTAMGSKDLNLGLSEIEPGIFWITLPTFNPNENQVKLFKSVIIKKLKKIKNPKAILFDVRGNTGGDSTWAHKILEPLYGAKTIEFVSEKISPKSMDYRVSQKNLEYFESVNKKHTKQHGKPQPFFIELVNELKKELEVGNSILTFNGSKKKPLNEGIPLNPFQKSIKTFILTDHHCFSACLSFVDMLREIPGVTHIGNETDSDALYMNNGEPISMSYEGFEFKYPMIYMNGRPRKNNQSLIPHQKMDTNLSQNEILKRILK